MLTIENLTKTIHQKRVLDHLSVTVKKGSIALFLGPSGVGKTTLLRVLNNLETVDSGALFIDGKMIDMNTIHQNHLIGMVFQHFNLFAHLTVQENITLALEKVLGLNSLQAQEIAQQLLDKYHLSDKAQLPVHKLSGGQKQRLCIARALALKPKIICMDEPTSALDPLLTKYVAGQIQALAHEGYTVLIATHDIKLLDYLSCTIHLMDNGKIVESASSDELKSYPEKYTMIGNFINGFAFS